MRKTRPAVAALAACVAICLIACIGLVSTTCDEQADDTKSTAAAREAVALMRRVSKRGAKITKEDVVRLYRHCWEHARQTGGIPASMGMFSVIMRENGPGAVPSLIAALGEQDVAALVIFDTILGIDHEHGTTCYADTLVSGEIDERQRASAISRALTNSDRRRLVAQLEELLRDQTKTGDARRRGASVLGEILGAMADPGNAHYIPLEERRWAIAKLGGVKAKASH